MGGSGLRRRLGAAGMSASMLSEDWSRQPYRESERGEETFGVTMSDASPHSPGMSPTLWSPQAVRRGWRCGFLRLDLWDADDSGSDAETHLHRAFS